MRLSRERRAQLVAEAESARGPSALGYVDVLREAGFRGGWGSTSDHERIVLVAAGDDVLADAMWSEPEVDGADMEHQPTNPMETRATASPPPAFPEPPITFSDDAYRLPRW